MTDAEIIEDVLEREGEGTPPYLVPGDAGLRTSWGVSERAHPLLWALGPPTKAQARTLYAAQYVKPFDVLIHAGVDDRIRVALIDDGVLSGVSESVKRLQHVLGVKQDGIIGPVTMTAIHQWHPAALLQSIVVERVHRLARIVERDHTQAKWIVGWLDRCLAFLPEVA